MMDDDIRKYWEDAASKKVQSFMRNIEVAKQQGRQYENALRTEDVRIVDVLVALRPERRNRIYISEVR
ncbi:MAG: hypothetical protein HKP25_03940 [Marinicaulis sp.]|nr:hypothetical protein [Marinicaulis sp.]NNL88198.1 hypothetical protein [Marinicaulis sp.]